MILAAGIARPATATSYATLNPSDAVSGAIFVWSNLIAQMATTAGAVRATKALGGLKYYWETWTLEDVSLITDYGYAGIANGSFTLTSASLGADTNGVGIKSDLGAIKLNGSTLATIGGFSASGNVCQIAVDGTAKRLWARINGTGNWNNDASADPATGANGLDISSISGSLYPTLWAAAQAQYDYAVNLGALSFRFTAPTGFVGVPG